MPHNFLVCKFCGNAQYVQSFGRTVHFHKISIYFVICTVSCFIMDPGVHTSWKCPGIYYFQSFVLEMPWNFFGQFTKFFSQSLFLYFAFSNFILYFLGFCILTTSHVIINFFSFSENN